MRPWAKLGRLLLEPTGYLGVVDLARGPLRASGWLRSNRERQSVDAAGRPLPWISYPAIRFLEERLRPSMKVFEYGSGNSTLWLSERVASVRSVEHDQAWYQATKDRVPANARLELVCLEYGGMYSRQVLEGGNEYDVVFIDGRDRVNCMIRCLPALAPGGVIVLDNSDRATYRPGIEHLASNGFRRLPFAGMAPIVTYVSETSVLYRPVNCLGI